MVVGSLVLVVEKARPRLSVSLRFHCLFVYVKVSKPLEGTLYRDKEGSGSRDGNYFLYTSLPL